MISLYALVIFAFNTVGFLFLTVLFVVLFKEFYSLYFHDNARYIIIVLGHKSKTF